MSAELVPVITFGLGILGTLGTQTLNERFVSGREREARKAEREVARDAFQRETLLGLQDVLLALLRSTADIYNFQRAAYRKTGSYATANEPEAMGVANREANALATRLMHRVLDDDLRARVGHLQERCARIIIPGHLRIEASGPAAADAAEQDFMAMAKEASLIEAHLGSVLRSLS